MQRLKMDPRNAADKKIVEDLLKYYLQIGEFEEAVKMANILSELN
jgi:hypothetical protein